MTFSFLVICFDHFLFKKSQACDIIIEISSIQYFKIHAIMKFYCSFAQETCFNNLFTSQKLFCFNKCAVLILLECNC